MALGQMGRDNKETQRTTFTSTPSKRSRAEQRRYQKKHPVKHTVTPTTRGQMGRNVQRSEGGAQVNGPTANAHLGGTGVQSATEVSSTPSITDGPINADPLYTASSDGPSDMSQTTGLGETQPKQGTPINVAPKAPVITPPPNLLGTTAPVQATPADQNAPGSPGNPTLVQRLQAFNEARNAGQLGQKVERQQAAPYQDPNVGLASKAKATALKRIMNGIGGVGTGSISLRGAAQAIAALTNTDVNAGVQRRGQDISANTADLNRQQQATSDANRQRIAEIRNRLADKNSALDRSSREGIASQNRASTDAYHQAVLGEQNQQLQQGAYEFQVRQQAAQRAAEAKAFSDKKDRDIRKRANNLKLLQAAMSKDGVSPSIDKNTYVGLKDLLFELDKQTQ